MRIAAGTPAGGGPDGGAATGSSSGVARSISATDDRCGDVDEGYALELMAEGRSNHAIADYLVVAERAVEKHVTSIFGKLGLTPAAEDHRRVLAVLAYLRALKGLL